jgi:hypothetical protein
MTNTYQQYLDDECTWKEYLSSLDIPTLKLGHTYIQSKGSWGEKHFKIIFIDDKIAVGLCIFNKISPKFIGNYAMFSVASAFKYQDTRPDYRLTE